PDISTLPLHDALPISIEIAAAVVSSPDDHFSPSPNSRVIGARSGRVSRRGRNPAVCAGIVAAATVQIAAGVVSIPDDHFTASPEDRKSTRLNSSHQII